MIGVSFTTLKCRPDFVIGFLSGIKVVSSYLGVYSSNLNIEYIQQDDII